MLITRLQTSATVDAKLAGHKVLVSEVREVFTNPHRVRRNRRAAGRIEVVGSTNGGRHLMVALDPTTDDTVWEIVTAFDLPKHQRTLLP